MSAAPGHWGLTACTQPPPASSLTTPPGPGHTSHLILCPLPTVPERPAVTHQGSLHGGHLTNATW
jgi:hypothetical protein